MSTYNVFGTDGIRAAIGSYPFTLTDITTIGAAIGDWAHTQHNASILIGTDSRFSAPYIRAGIIAGLSAAHIDTVDVGIIPSAALVPLLQAGYGTHGIMLSASHNPYHDNGIKLFTSDGKITTHDEEQISKHIRSIRPRCPIRCGTTCTWPDAYQVYYDHIHAHFAADLLKDMHILIDAAYGAAALHAEKLFTQLGAHVTSIHNVPDGYAINMSCGATYPAALQQAMQTHKADIGFAFDGDADRVIIVDKDGTYKDGDDILALLSNHPDYVNDAAICGTQMSNMGLEQYCKNHNKPLIRAEVGDKAVCMALVQHGIQLGGEPSGHIILRDILPTGDGIITALKVIECMRMTDNSTMNILNKCPYYLTDIHVSQRIDLHKSSLAAIINTYAAHVQPHGRLLVRYSGTEPKLRILAEADTIDKAEYVAYACARELHKALGIV